MGKTKINYRNYKIVEFTIFYNYDLKEILGFTHKKEPFNDFASSQVEMCKTESSKLDLLSRANFIKSLEDVHKMLKEDAMKKFEIFYSIYEDK